MNTNGQGLG
uniref:Uncharacterized protein LOC100178654 n=1 Tax=Phallusia mammillata TaxID=59560 RepID=A0A6F9DG61_9ASCI|nr:uncharacterized protein LOC100178654 [Phallusia mammillata]